jgi:hypothetical protein
MNEIHFLTGGSLLFSCPLNIEKRTDIIWLVMFVYEHMGQSIIKMVYRIEISSFFVYFAMQEESVKFASQMSPMSSLLWINLCNSATYRWCIHIVPSIYCRPFLCRAARMTSSSSTEGAGDFSRGTWKSISLCFHINHTVVFKNPFSSDES